MSEENNKEKISKEKNKHNKSSKAQPKDNKGTKKMKFSQKHPKISLTIRLMFLLILIVLVVLTGIVVGMLYGSWGENFKITEEELVIGSSNSIILDKDGNKLAELIGDENRKIIKIDNKYKNLKNAYIAIEDERFLEHEGVDFKRTSAAILQYIKNGGSSSFGGSTITQQLVKNITSDDEKTGTAGIIRKVKEWAKAYQIERMISKDQIMELYLNIIFVGGNNHGVEVGAEYYFNKTAAELDLAECAFLAGINHTPNSYNPYSGKDNKEIIKTRTKTVLNKMLELGMISKEEYDEAVNKVDQGFNFQKAYSTGTMYSYHTDATIAKVISDIAKEKDISKNLASTYVYSSGLTIHSTQDSALQAKMEEVMAGNSGQYTRKSTLVPGTTSQAAMVVIDNATGYAVGVVGGLGQKNESRGLNRATQSTRQTGSSIKPLTSLVPGINEGVITAATIYNDAETDFGIKGWKPKDYNAYKGLISIRSAVTTSQNIPFIKVVKELGTDKAITYLEKMGITSVDKTKDGLASLSLGGFTKGISPFEMAGAYATIANNGVYREPLLYTKITDSSGEVVFEPKQRTEQVLSEQAAYVIKNILKSVVTSGTATYCKVSGMDVGAKTGTTNDNYDKWLCGFTNYYTGTCWYGFDKNEEVVGSNNVAGKIWSAVMTRVHAGKPASSFNKPSGVVTETICKASGKKATGKCTDTYQEVFVSGTVPKGCDGHAKSEQVCSDSGLRATENCPNVVTKYSSYTVDKEKLGLWKSSGSSSASLPNEYCKIHKAGAQENPEADKPTITLKGEANITIKVGEKYEEKGATAKDSTDGDISSKIKISGTVNTSKAGTYTVTYTVENSKKKTAEVKRTIVVQEDKKNETPSTNTNKNNTTTPPTNTETNTNTNTATNTSTNSQNNTTTNTNTTEDKSKQNTTGNATN